MKLTLVLILFFQILSVCATSNDSTFIRVYFLYGSKPKKKFKKEEPKWFGGKLGGHVGIGLDSNTIIDFLPRGSLHVFAKNDDPHGQFVLHSRRGFWEVFGGRQDEVKKAIVEIPISLDQRMQIDSIANNYLKTTPYDYAFFGMRCGASTYEILAQLGILKELSYRKTFWKIFYPKKLRRRLFKLANKNGWKIIKIEGSEKRKWEKD